jgi:hypothetical protein
MLRFLLILQILVCYVNGYCQEVSQHNQNDTLGNETGLCEGYDIEHIKYSETMYANGNVEYTYYFTKQGDTISVYNWAINVIAIKKIKEYILSNFVINEFTEAQGSATLLLILDFESNVSEIRVIRGITENFNNELLRVIHKIEKDLIFVCTADCKTPIVTPFTIRLFD